MTAAVLCNHARLRPPDGNGAEWTALGDPTEAALLAVAAKAGLDRPFDVEPSADDLRPFLNGWSPDAPRKEDPAKEAPKSEPNDLSDRGASQARPWYPGRKPWW